MVSIAANNLHTRQTKVHAQLSGSQHSAAGGVTGAACLVVPSPTGSRLPDTTPGVTANTCCRLSYGRAQLGWRLAGQDNKLVPLDTLLDNLMAAPPAALYNAAPGASHSRVCVAGVHALCVALDALLVRQDERPPQRRILPPEVVVNLAVQPVVQQHQLRTAA